MKYECVVRWSGRDGGEREMRHQAPSKAAAEEWLAWQLLLQAGEIGLHGYVRKLP